MDGDAMEVNPSVVVEFVGVEGHGHLRCAALQPGVYVAVGKAVDDDVGAFDVFVCLCGKLSHHSPVLGNVSSFPCYLKIFELRWGVEGRVKVNATEVDVGNGVDFIALAYDEFLSESEFGARSRCLSLADVGNVVAVGVVGVLGVAV